jgi:hypothetical protein
MTEEANFFSVRRALQRIALPFMSRSSSSVMSPTAKMSGSMTTARP